MAAGAGVTAGLLLLGALLVIEAHRGRVGRFQPAVHHYLAAVAAAVVGTGLGAAMVGGATGLRDAHVILNLLGLAGLTIAGTLPYFTATQVRMRMSPRATPGRQHTTLAWLAGSVAVAATAAVWQRPVLVGVGLAGYATCLLAVLTFLPVPGVKQWRWAGPRVVMLASGIAWWAGSVAVAAARSLAAQPVLPERHVVVLVVGGYAQILVASLAYLGPVLRGGGHQQLAVGFAVSRSWMALVAINVAAVAWALSQPRLAMAAVVVAIGDLAVRTTRLFAGGGIDASREAAPRPGAPSADGPG